MQKIIQTKDGPVLLTDEASLGADSLDAHSPGADSLGAHSAADPMPIIGIGLAFHGKADLIVESEEQLSDTLLENTARHFYHLPVTIAQTRRLLIREMTEEEIPLLFELDRRVASPFVPANEYTGLTPQQRHETFIAYRKWAYETLQLGLYLLFERTSGQLIGRAGFSMGDYGEADVMLSYEIIRQKRRQGFAREASQALLQYAESLGIYTIAALIDEDNEASERLALSLGFARAGICQGKRLFLRFRVEK